MFEPADLLLLRDQALDWFFASVWTPAVLSQALLIILAALPAVLVHRLSMRRLTDAVTALRVSPRLKYILHNLKRLVFPVALLVLLLAARLVLAAGHVAGDTGLVNAAINLLLAWIVIELAVQFISNSFIRGVFAMTIWAIAALQIVGLLEAATAGLDHLAFSMGKFRLSLLSIVKGLFALCFLLYGAAFVSSLLERHIRINKSLTPTSKVLISKSIRIMLVTFALLIAVTSAGIDLSLLAVFSGGIGLGLGFGLQKVVSNLFSGMLLLLDRSIKPGDIIEMPNGAFGWVEHMGARYTEIVTRDNKSYLIPNENFITQQVVNWSHGDTLVRLELDFNVHYRSDPHHVKKVAEVAAARPERVVNSPSPLCHLYQFGESGLVFRLRFWIRDAEKGVTNMRGEVMLALWDAFREEGIMIPYPHRVLHMGSEDPFDPVAAGKNAGLG